MRLRQVLSLLALACAVAAVTGSCAGDAPVPSPESAVELISNLKAVADQQALFDPDKTARLLALDINAGQPVTRTDFDCKKDRISWDQSHRDYSVKTDWYHMQPNGIRQSYPRAFINPAGQTGEPTISYWSATSTQKCGLEAFLKKRESARLDLQNLPGFACITPDMIIRIGGKYTRATDGVSIASYEHNTDDAVTTIEFTFRAMAMCALGASITQSNERNLRWLRADKKFEICVLPEKRNTVRLIQASRGLMATSKMKWNRWALPSVTVLFRLSTTVSRVTGRPRSP